MPTIQELVPLLAEPREDLDAEYKGWLDLRTNEHKATLAKAAIALVNHGGGFIVLGMAEDDDGWRSAPRPADFPDATQDVVNAAINRYADPEIHCQVYAVPHPLTGVVHPVISTPSNLRVPAMSSRSCDGVLHQQRCYIRKPGPRSEEPHTAEEWRALLDRCLRAGREDMLEAIRTIVTGRVDEPAQPLAATPAFDQFVRDARVRWEELTHVLPERSPSRFPHGHYDMAFGLVGAQPAATLNDLRARLAQARQVRLTGWTPFLEMHTAGWEPYAHEDYVEAWVGRPVRDDALRREPGHCDFWRASREGNLYTIRGYSEDGLENRPAGELFDVTVPVWRLGEGILFAQRLAETYEGVEAIEVRSEFVGLAGRRLVSIGDRRFMIDDRVSGTERIVLRSRATMGEVRDNLAELVHGLLRPLYERFAFFDLPFELVDEELVRMRQRRF